MQASQVRRMMVHMLAAVLVLCMSVGLAGAQEDKFPVKPIRMIITHDVGGSVDIAGRSLIPYLEKNLGVNIQPENMVGAGGRRAMEYVFNQAPADGYTIVVSAFPSRLLGELTYPDSKYKMAEFVHLGAWLGKDYRSILVARASKLQSLQDLINESKKRKLTAAGGGGLGSTSQLQAVMLKEVVGMNAEFIPFDSTAEVAAAVLGKHVDFGLMPLSSSLRYEATGDIKIVAVHSPQRIPECPDVPTMEELGFPGVVIPYGVGAWAPPKTPPSRAKILADAIWKAANDPAYTQWANKAGVLLEPLTAEEFLKRTLDDYKSIQKVLPILMREAGTAK
ncbi:MAG: tripartite tricarboxylate transporter substrate binding protein [Firmicutes bacterium]|nr:tripartite tricarboxylate transporter substrate binding protein [Bacillota bacterium]